MENILLPMCIPLQRSSLPIQMEDQKRKYPMSSLAPLFRPVRQSHIYCIRNRWSLLSKKISDHLFRPLKRRPLSQTKVVNPKTGRSWQIRSISQRLTSLQVIIRSRPILPPSLSSGNFPYLVDLRQPSSIQSKEIKGKVISNLKSHVWWRITHR